MISSKQENRQRGLKRCSNNGSIVRSHRVNGSVYSVTTRTGAQTSVSLPI